MSSLYDESALDPLGLNQGMLGGSGGEDLHTYLKRLSRPSLELKEGDGLRVSKDPNNKGLTAGGHWLGENSGYNEGDLISPQQKADWYDSDFDAAYRGAMKNFKGFEQLDRDQQLAALSVSYQNGEFLEQEHPNATSLWRQGMFNEGAAEFAKNSAGDGPADWLSQPQAERQLDDLKTLTKGFDITDPSTWRTGAGIALENVPGTTIKAPTDRSLATGAPASTALAAAGVPPAPNQQPGTTGDATSALGKAGEWVGALGTEFGASLADMGSLIADMADFGQFGPDDFTDKLAAKMSGFADTMRKSKPAWIQAQEQNEIVSYGKDGSLEFNMPNFTQVANLRFADIRSIRPSQFTDHVERQHKNRWTTTRSHTAKFKGFVPRCRCQPFPVRPEKHRSSLRPPKRELANRLSFGHRSSDCLAASPVDHR